MDESVFQRVVEAFNSDDHDRRVDLLGGVLAVDAEVAHIHGVSVGPEAFSRDVGRIREVIPAGLSALLQGEVDSLQRALENAAQISAAPGVGGAPIRQRIEVREIMTMPED